jgi:hypothetical protein
VKDSLRKALSLQQFPGFEPERSNRVKSVALNDLTRQTQNCKGLTSVPIRAPEFYTISTINFPDGINNLAVGAQRGMP